MPDKSQEPMNLPPPAAPVGIPVVPQTDFVDDEDLLKEELARITPSNAVLLEWAKKNPPPPEYFEGEEEMPFDPGPTHQTPRELLPRGLI